MKPAPPKPQPRLLFTDPDRTMLAWCRRTHVHPGPTTGTTDGTRPLAADATLRDVLVLPGEAVVSHWLELPSRSDAQALAAARLQIGRHVADASDMHLVLGTTAADGRRQALLVDAGVLQRHLDTARQLGARPIVAVPDYMLLPAGGGPMPGILVQGSRWLVRGDGQAFTAEADLAMLLLDDPAHPAALGVDEARARLLDGVDHSTINLLQGRFAASDGGDGSRHGWRLAGMLGAALLATLPLATAFDAVMHARAANRLEADARALAARLADSPGAGFSGNGVLATVLLDAVAGLPGARVEHLEWEAPDRIEAELRHAGARDLDAIRDAWTAAGLGVELEPPRSEGSSHVTRVALEGAPR